MGQRFGTELLGLPQLDDQGISNYSPADYEELMKVASIKPLLGGRPAASLPPPAASSTKLLGPEVGEYLRKQSSAVPQGPESPWGQNSFVLYNSFYVQVARVKKMGELQKLHVLPGVV